MTSDRDVLPPKAVGWLPLWRQANWPARLLFIALVALFADRALYSVKVGRADRLGFLDMGEEALKGDFDRELTRNTYPPPFPVAMAPLAALRTVIGEPASRYLWGVAQLAALAFLTLEFGWALELDLTLGMIALGWLSVWRPIVADLNNQNVSLFLLALVAAALGCLRRAHPAAAGMLIGTGASLKVWPGLALIGCLREPRVVRPLLGGVLVAIGLATLAVIGMLGPARAIAAVRFWLDEVAPRAGGPELANQSWRAEVLRLSGTLGHAAETGPYRWELSRAGSMGFMIGVVLWLGFVFFTLIRPGRIWRVRCLDSVLSLVLGTTALPVAWAHAYVVLLPLALAIVASAPSLRTPGRRGVLALFLVGVVLTSLLDYDLVGRALASRLAFCGNGLLSALFLFAAGLGLRRFWQDRDAIAVGEGSRSSGA